MFKKMLFGMMVVAVLMAGQNSDVLAKYPEKNITFVIPYSPGGGFDTYVRAIAPVLEKYLPNKVNVIPKNIPGAGGRKGANHLFRAKPDGYTISIFNFPGIALSQLNGKLKWDLKKVTWLAQIGEDKYGIAVKGSSKLNSIQDMKNLGRPVKFTSTGTGTTSNVVTVISSSALGIKQEVITGYKGSKNSILGTIRGDGDAVVMVLGTLRKYVKSGDLKLLATLTANSPFPNVPNTSALGVPQLSKLGIARLVGGTPGIPADTKNILAGALFKALNDPGFLAWAKKVKRPVNPLNADGAGKEVENQFVPFAIIV